MGQRTAIVLQYVNNCDTKWNDNNKKVNTRVFFHMWGIGRILPAQFLSILHGTLTADTFNDVSFVKSMCPPGCIDITDKYDKDGLMNLSFDDPQNVGRIIDEADNNNGGIFIRISITFGASYSIESIEYAYMLGHEEGGNYESFCSQEEWMAKAGVPYIDDEFKDLYYRTLAYFGAKERK